MRITSVRIYPAKAPSGDIVAYASIGFDGVFAVNGLKIVKNMDGLNVFYPNRKIGNGNIRDVAHPIDNEFREYVEQEVIRAYQQSGQGDRGSGELPFRKP